MRASTDLRISAIGVEELSRCSLVALISYEIEVLRCQRLVPSELSQTTLALPVRATKGLREY